MLRIKRLSARFDSPDMAVIKIKCNDIIFKNPKSGEFTVVDGNFTHMMTLYDKSTLIVRERFIYKLAKFLRLV